ncbi:MAG TPA: sigma-54-dependent Fis family transcriptional regulator [Desulfobacterales bacterium]|nr:sigma-54-dependent Fis family transcriptional regulator [Desulfobacterales bacterium]
MSSINKKDKEDKKILIVEDERETRISMFEFLNDKGYQVMVAENGHMALDMLDNTPVDLVISDIRMPEMSGLELLRRLRIKDPALPVIIVTGFAGVDTAVEAMKRGAYDYVLKPFPEEVIGETVRQALMVGQAALPSLAHGVEKGGPALEEKPVIGNDPRWLQVMSKARAVASSTATVLILGESGTGKEVVARAIHQESERRQGPFVALNCAALPDGLLESELFGHEKGAFTGAAAMKKGKFELAHGGTLLLDEIGEIPLHLQAKLLRVLQENVVDRLGGKTPVKFDAHIVATTNCNLMEAVERGEFRRDLFYRLNVIPLNLPPLRERKGDIGALAAYFAARYASRYDKPLKELSPAALQRFLSYEWPGNVREMENMLERAVLLSHGSFLEPWDLWDEAPPAGKAVEESSTLQPAAEGGTRSEALPAVAGGQVIPLKEVERQMILQALHKTDNNRTHAAKMLGISVRTLRNKLHEYRSSGLMF